MFLILLIVLSQFISFDVAVLHRVLFPGNRFFLPAAPPPEELANYGCAEGMWGYWEDSSGISTPVCRALNITWEHHQAIQMQSALARLSPVCYAQLFGMSVRSPMHKNPPTPADTAADTLATFVHPHHCLGTHNSAITRCVASVLYPFINLPLCLVTAKPFPS